MVSEEKEVRRRASPHIPRTNNYSYFTEQTRQVGRMGSEFRRTQREHFQNHHHHHNHQQHFHPQIRPHLHPYPHPRDIMQEEIQREIEKERIREEIIMSEIMRRRVLEAEVRRELMMEREFALQRGGDGLPFVSSPVTGFDSPVGSAGKSTEERILLSLREKEMLNGGFESLPFQRRSADLRISEVQPVSEDGKEKEKIVSLVKPDENISGSKRKAPTPPTGEDATEFPSDSVSSKKARADVTCDICQLIATSKQALNEHLRGKKHKAKEAALTAKNYSIGLMSNKLTKPVNTDQGTEDGTRLTSESLPKGETGELSSKGDGPQQENLNSDNLKRNQFVAVGEVEKNDNPKKKKFKHWCEMCQVGAPSRKVMNAHTKGRKHLRRLEGNKLNGGAGPSNEGKAPVTLMNLGVAQDEEDIASSDNIGKALEEARSEDREVKDANKSEDHETVDETKAEDGEADDLAERDAADEPRDDDLAKRDDDLAEPDAADEPKDDDELAEPDDDFDSQMMTWLSQM